MITKTKRRGIGNVIAAGVMVFLMVFTVGQLYVHSINLLDGYMQVAEKMLTRDLQKQNERITISNARITLPPGGNIMVDLTITNAGGETAHITSVWINNADVSTSPHKRITKETNPSVDKFIGAGLSAIITGLDSGITTAPPSPRIAIKVFTEMGNSASLQLIPPTIMGVTPDTSVAVQLTVVPPNPITGNNITIVLSVTNNNALGVAFTALQPDIRIVQGTTPETGLPCDLTSSNSQPVTCTLKKSPATLDFLPFGGTGVFQWIYEVKTIRADSQITFTASYIPLSTPGLLASQKPSQTSIIRSAGGASNDLGGNLPTAFGDIAAFFQSFEFSQDNGATWETGFFIANNKNTIFRIRVTNLGSSTIELTIDSELVLLETGSNAKLEFFIIQPCPCINSYPPASGKTQISPAQITTIYFGAKSAGGTLPVKVGIAGKLYLGTVFIVGTRLPENKPFSQNTLILGVTTK